MTRSRSSQTSHKFGTSDTEPDTTSEVGRDAMESAKRAASEAASSVRDEVRGLLDRQVGEGAAYLGYAASSIRAAADDLSRNAPPLANFADIVADRLESYADTVREKSAEEVWADAIDFTRRQPALVFGLASLAGFLAYRTVRSAARADKDETERELHGA